MRASWLPALLLVGCARSSATTDAGATAVWLGDATPATNYALLSAGDCGDLILSDRGTTVRSWPRGSCDPCLMGCASFAGPLAAQEPIGAKSHPYIAAMLGCAAWCTDGGTR